MAWTHISSIKASGGKSVSNTMSDCINYGINPEKTDGGQLVSVYGCTPSTAPQKFLQSKHQYHAAGGRELPVHKDVLLYHMKQSFKPGEISPDEANRIGYETALRFTKGNHAFVVGTHVDRGHVHNHIYFNAVQLDLDKKFKNSDWPAIALRRTSDHICLENGLSIIENPKQSSLSKKLTAQYRQDNKYTRLTNRDALRANIDLALHKHQPKNLKEFLEVLKNDFGWLAKQRGKNISLSHKDYKQPIRLTEKSLGEGYGKDDIESKLSNHKEMAHIDASNTPSADLSTALHQPEPQSFLAQLQSSIHALLEAGYKDRDAINALSYLNQHGIDTLDKLDGRLEAVRNKQDLAGDALVSTDKRLAEIDELSIEIKNYNEGAPVHEQYVKLKAWQPSATDKIKGTPHPAPQFYEANRATLMRYEAAINYFTQHGYGKSKGKPVPHTDDLRRERAALQKERGKQSNNHRKYSKEVRELSKVKAVSRALLNAPTHQLSQPNLDHVQVGR
ncbi:MAG: relaxase/mobilization nuclease domain-containing protein [Defluviitaleaceae bacterium]|nr:relaxase/mobilization nuclease domain-containing protein [Defluviitaleaceae bacterium]